MSCTAKPFRSKLNQERNRPMTSAAQAAAATPDAVANAGIFEITPPSGWWAVPFREIWKYRELLYFLVWRDIKVRYKQTAIGVAWVVLQPLHCQTIMGVRENNPSAESATVTSPHA
jgi:hypothetical protein